MGQAAAEDLCARGTSLGVACEIVEFPGKHDWPSAAMAFAATLPWIAGRLDGGSPR